MNFNNLAGAVALGFAVASPSAFANLVTNGGFESPVVAAVVGYEYRTTGNAGWDWTTFSSGSGTVQFNSAYSGQTIGAGLQSVQLEYSGDFISQLISTTAGAEYTLSFLLASYFPPGIDSLRVFVDANTYDFAGTAAWTAHSFNFFASSSSTLIKFMNTDPLPNPPYTYPHLDNISVLAVPAPATLALVGLGLAALGWSRRQRI